MGKYVVGIDIGTSGTKTVLFDENCQVMASATQEYPLSQPENGWAEQNPEDWYAAVVKTIREVLAKAAVNAADIAGLGLSGQMHGLVMLDAQNAVIRPAILWCDQRTGRQCREITEKIGASRLIEITANPALTGFTASKILWVRENEPEQYKKCAHILLPKDYIRLRMTGEFATDVSDASGMQLLDVVHRCWSDEVLEKLEIDKNLLAAVYESQEITGHITETASAETGLPVTVVVAGGAGDNAAAAVGTGTVREGRAFTTIGTSGVVYAHTEKPVIDPLGRVHTFCCAVPGAWHVMGVTQAAALSLNWYLDTLCKNYTDEAKKQGINLFALVNDKIAAVPRGSHKLFYLPYLMGERTPHLDPDCRGVFFGLSAIHTQEDLLRAVMEGVSYSLKDCQRILSEMGISVERMMACGGGSRSPVWRQILADLFVCPVQTANTQEGAVLGAAILGGVAAGVFSSIEEICDRCIVPSDSSLPEDAGKEYYQKAYPLYRQLYVQLKESYQQLADL